MNSKRLVLGVFTVMFLIAGGILGSSQLRATSQGQTATITAATLTPDAMSAAEIMQRVSTAVSQANTYRFDQVDVATDPEALLVSGEVNREEQSVRIISADGAITSYYIGTQYHQQVNASWTSSELNEPYEDTLGFNLRLFQEPTVAWSVEDQVTPEGDAAYLLQQTGTARSGASITVAMWIDAATSLPLVISENSTDPFDTLISQIETRYFDWGTSIDIQVPQGTSQETQGSSNDDAVYVVPLNVTLSPAGDGWQNVSVDFALYNGSSTYLRAPLLPDYEASVAIIEGPTYDVEVAGQDWDDSTFSLVPMTPGMVACGIVREGSTSLDEPLMLQVTGRIPQDTTPATLMLGPFPPADLTEIAPEGFCQVDATALPSNAEPIVLGADGNVVHAELRLTGSEDGTTVVAELANLNKFDDLLLDDLRIWAGYDNGIWSAPVGGASSDDERCGWANSDDLTLGPSQNTSFSFCLPTSANRVVVLIIESQAGDTRQGMQVESVAEVAEQLGTVIFRPARWNDPGGSCERENAQVVLSSPDRDAGTVEPLVEGAVYEITGPSIEAYYSGLNNDILWPVRGVESGSVGYIWDFCLRIGPAPSGEREPSSGDQLAAVREAEVIDAFNTGKVANKVENEER